MTFDEVAFPIYVLDPEAYISEEDGILWCEGKVLDNLNVKGETLGERRLRSPLTDLYPLKKGIHSLEELLRYSKPPKFIDKVGKLGSYRRSQTMHLKCHKVKRTTLMGNYCIVQVYGVNFPIRERRPPDKEYAKVLYKDKIPWMILDYCHHPFKDTWRKI